MPIPSGPEDLLVLILRSNDSTSFSFVVILSKRVSVRYLKFGRSGIITVRLNALVLYVDILNDSQGELVTTITQILVRMVI